MIENIYLSRLSIDENKDKALVDAKKGMELIECPSCSIFLYFDEE